MNVFDLLTQRVGAAVEALAADGVLVSPPNLARIVVEPPRDPSHGDMATNAAMVLAKEAGKKPRERAEALAEKLRADDLVAKVEVAGPGFINFYLSKGFFGDAVKGIDADFGKNKNLAGKKVMVEYTNTNLFKELHIGHMMSNNIG